MRRSHHRRLIGLPLDPVECGNPFFLEESVRTLVETGGLVGEPGAYRLAKPIQSMQVPATVQAVLAARIDRLPCRRSPPAAAAVIGTEVPSAASAGHCRHAEVGAASPPGAPPDGRVPVRDAPVPRA